MCLWGGGVGRVRSAQARARACVHVCCCDRWSIQRTHRLAGLVVKASASRAGDPGFESRLRRDFFGVESYQ